MVLHGDAFSLWSEFVWTVLGKLVSCLVVFINGGVNSRSGCKTCSVEQMSKRVVRRGRRDCIAVLRARCTRFPWCSD